MRLLIRGGNVPTGKLQQADRPAGGKSACGWKTWFSLQEVVFEMSLKEELEDEDFLQRRCYARKAWRIQRVLEGNRKGP